MDLILERNFEYYNNVKQTLKNILQNRIMILQGPLEIDDPTLNLSGYDYCPEEVNVNNLLNHKTHNNIYEMHMEYLKAGADFLKSFKGTTVARKDYNPTDIAYRLNCETASIARRATTKYTEDTGILKFVVGALGATQRIQSKLTGSKPNNRKFTFDELVDVYIEETKGLLDGTADILIVEALFDNINVKAALFAIETVLEERNLRVPIFISGTIVDESGRTLSGQTPEAFLISTSHADPMCVGLNCALGASEMKPFVERVSRNTKSFVICYPDAVLPHFVGDDDEMEEYMGNMLKALAEDGLVNIVGGCCGTTPHLIRAISAAVEGIAPRVPPRSLHDTALKLSGLDPLTIDNFSTFVNISDKCNVARSIKFFKVIKENKFDKALTMAKIQVEKGAAMLNINMDKEMLDGKKCMAKFIKLITSRPDIGRVPLCIDSSNFEIITAGLKCTQGKCLVNNISLKDGEEDFIRKARLIRKFGAAIVVMAFDEKGQATEAARKSEILLRSHNILIEVGYNPTDIIFDPIVPTIGTEMGVHEESASHFIEAITLMKVMIPQCKFIGRVTNLSSTFQGKEKIRKAMQSVFLYHAIKAGMDMGIVDAVRLPLSSLNKELLDLCEDILRTPGASRQLLVRPEVGNYLSLNSARENKLTINWKKYPPMCEPSSLITKRFKNNRLIPNIDWEEFFNVCQIRGWEAEKSLKEAQTIIRQRVLTCTWAVGFWRAASVGDDIKIFNRLGNHIATLYGLRQQAEKVTNPAESHYCISDFVVPEVLGLKDYIGVFAVTCLKDNDLAEWFGPYDDTMMNAVADRLTEAHTEELQKRAERLFLGIKNEAFNATDQKLKYQGVRLTLGNLGQPDPTEKDTVWELLRPHFGNQTESLAVMPTSSVCGFFFPHANSITFTTGKITKEQVYDYSLRKQIEFKQIEKWLFPLLSYNPYIQNNLSHLEPECLEINLKEFLASPIIPHHVDNLKHIMLQLVMGVQEIHEMGFVHCGLNDESVLVQIKKEDLIVRFSDFDACVKSGGKVNLQDKDKAFVPKEYRDSTYCVADPSFDVFSLGILFLNIITGGQIRNKLEFIDSYYTDDHILQYPDHDMAMDAIRKMISSRSEERPTLDELRNDPIVWTDGQLIHYIRISHETLKSKRDKFDKEISKEKAKKLEIEESSKKTEESKRNIELDIKEQYKALSLDNKEKVENWRTELKVDGVLSGDAETKVNARIKSLFISQIKKILKPEPKVRNPYEINSDNFPETKIVVGEKEDWVERIPVEEIRKDLGGGRKSFQVLLSTCRHKFSHHPNLDGFYGKYPRGLIQNLVLPFPRFIPVLISIMKKLNLHTSIMRSMKSLKFNLRFTSDDQDD